VKPNSPTILILLLLINVNEVLGVACMMNVDTVVWRLNLAVFINKNFIVPLKQSIHCKNKLKYEQIMLMNRVNAYHNKLIKSSCHFPPQ